MKIRKTHTLLENFRNWTEQDPIKEKLNQWNELRNIRRTALKEISDDAIERISDYVGDNLNPENLSFDSVFDGATRIVIPMGEGEVKGEIGEMVAFLEKNGWTLDFASGTAMRTKEVEIPKGPRAGEKIQKQEKQRIGKLLSVFEDFHNKNVKRNRIEVAYRNDGKGRNYENDPEYQKWNKQAEQAEARVTAAFPRLSSNIRDATIWWGSSTKEPKGVRWVKLWNEKSEFFRKNPESASEREDTKYSIVISRHPVDVLRMSDYANIQSCHSEGSSYFHCAIGEAKGHGLVAYQVLTKDLAKVDLEDDEIFRDPQRHVDGITPTSRLRLRKLTYKHGTDESTSLAVPESRVYGRRDPDFKESIMKWAGKSQKETIQNIPWDEVDDNDFVFEGGSYIDSSMTTLLFDMLDSSDAVGQDVVDDITEWDSINWEGEEEDEFANIAEEYEERASDIEAWVRRHVEHGWISYEVQDDMGFGEPPYVYFSGGFSVDIADVLPENAELLTGDEDDIFMHLHGAFSYHGFGTSWSHQEEYGGDYRFEISNEDYGIDPDGMEEYADYLRDIDNNWDEIMETFVEGLRESGYLSGLSQSFLEDMLGKYVGDMDAEAEVHDGGASITWQILVDLGEDVKEVLSQLPEEIRSKIWKTFEDKGKQIVIKNWLEPLEEKMTWDDEESEPHRQTFGLFQKGEGNFFYRISEEYEVVDMSQAENIGLFLNEIDDRVSIIKSTMVELMTEMLKKVASYADAERKGQQRLPGIDERKRRKAKQTASTLMEGFRKWHDA